MRLSIRISRWLKKYAKGAGTKGYVVGLSGGVDSAVVAALCVKAVGKDNVIGAILPCGGSLDDDRLAGDVVDWLGIKSKKVVLGKAYTYLSAQMPIGETNMPQMNLKPRLRMTVLYFLANTFNYLVAGTGNRSEREIGYFTKYGDGGCDVLPLGDLYKSQVYELAEELGVPREIIDRPPSAGLWVGQTDEEDIGMTYEELDAVLDGNQTVHLDSYERVNVMRKAAGHKLNMPPVFESEREIGYFTKEYKLNMPPVFEDVPEIETPEDKLEEPEKEEQESEEVETEE